MIIITIISREIFCWSVGNMVYSPINFKDGTCPVCGAIKSITSIDKFNRDARNQIYPIYKMRCKSCSAEFFIRWEDCKDTKETATPVAVSRSNINLFVESLQDRLKDLPKPEDIYKEDSY